MLLRLLQWRTGCGRTNGSDFGWKGGWKNEKNFGIAEKSVLSCTKKYQNNVLYSVETDNFVNGNAFV